MFGSFPSCHRCCLAIRMCVSVLLWKLPKNGLIHCNSCINDMGHCASVHDCMTKQWCLLGWHLCMPLTRTALHTQLSMIVEVFGIPDIAGTNQNGALKP